MKHIDLFDNLVKESIKYMEDYTENIARGGNTYNDTRGNVIIALGRCVHVSSEFDSNVMSVLKNLESALPNFEESHVAQVVYLAHLARARYTKTQFDSTENE